MLETIVESAIALAPPNIYPLSNYEIESLEGHQEDAPNAALLANERGEYGAARYLYQHFFGHHFSVGTDFASDGAGMNVESVNPLTTGVIKKTDPPRDIDLYWHVGLNNTEHGPIELTAENIKATVDLFNERGRSISGDVNHASKMTKGPCFVPVHVGKIYDVGGRLRASSLQWTEKGAELVGSGDLLYTSIALRESTKIDWDDVAQVWKVDGPLDIESLALTNDPAYYGAKPMRSDIAFSAGHKPLQWTFAMPPPPPPAKGKQPQAPPAAPPQEGAPVPPHAQTAEGAPPAPPPAPGGQPGAHPAAVPEDTEGRENGTQAAMTDILDALLSRADLPEDAQKHLANLKGMVVELSNINKTEAQAQTAIAPAAAPVAAVPAAPEGEAEKAYAIIQKHFGVVTPEVLEAKILSGKRAKSKLSTVKKDAVVTEGNEKKTLLQLCIERQVYSPHDSEGHADFLNMSIGACRAFAQEEGLALPVPSVHDLAVFSANPMPQPAPVTGAGQKDALMKVFKEGFAMAANRHQRKGSSK